MKRTGPMNTQLQQLITELKVAAAKDNVPLWRRLAQDLERPARQRRIVNLTRINAYTKPDETIVVPGKVLAGGELDHKVNVIAFSFSNDAEQKIRSLKGDCLSVQELLKKNPKGKNVRIIG